MKFFQYFNIILKNKYYNGKKYSNKKQSNTSGKKVSSGKSTFLNYVIGEEILETLNDITTKCIF